LDLAGNKNISGLGLGFDIVSIEYFEIRESMFVDVVVESSSGLFLDVRRSAWILGQWMIAENG
jgi:hypothetical protein